MHTQVTLSEDLLIHGQPTHFVHQLLQRFEQIAEDVALNLRIKVDATCRIFLKELNKTTKVLINLELEYTQRPM